MEPTEGSGDGVAISVNAQGITYDLTFAPGNTYNVTINTSGHWRCTVPNYVSYKRIIGMFNGEEISIDSWQTQSNTISSPGADKTVTFSIDVDAPTGLKFDTDHY